MLAACRPEVFVTRATGFYPRTLFVLVPCGLLWLGGFEALEEEIRRLAGSDLAARVEIVRGVSNRVVFYVEERDQPLINLEAVDRFRRSYKEHTNPSTLHIDRRWAESAEMATLIEELAAIETASVRVEDAKTDSIEGETTN